ncbi:unnamed protein product [Rotaria magnacalcarata]|uniref:Uncharacterized protein n=1 Tax=Rotaria magnacalcarata TaxID=392030 RepID=A0A816ZIP4_9BILA|nr:unnamed protein product [Rotaria magnacalcarata]CAF1668002.1 unnamed protein product [Rotaria magnacalcarata]CAF2075269.1 unnamed protein product [Rotaria magnacalcarata]CAF2126461.1 unnamed protein product [Rotaria magnacalcarata]CAF2198110.1 unnamed protein product [Rotaria magnacalcarata]
MSENLTFFIPYHTGYAHAELVHSFASYTDVHLFIYKWNPAYERVKQYFSHVKQIHIHEFSIDNIISQLIEEKHRKVVILLTASINYLFGQLQLRLFRLIQQYSPSVIDVYPVGHCMYGCQSCAYAYTHCLPITFTNYIQTKETKLSFEKDFEILICPSYSFTNAPFSLLSNSDIIEYMLKLDYPHAIKLHPLAYEYKDNEKHPFLSLINIEKQHVEKLFQSKNVILNEQTSTLKLIEHARVIICDSNSSVPFETLYFHDNKFIFVYETIEESDEQDDRQHYFHKFHTVEQLKYLIENYFNHQLDCKTENSHDFFLEKYDEPNGNEIEQLAQIRQWIKTDEENDEKESFDLDSIKATVYDEFKSISTPMALYTLGDHTMSEIVQIYFSDENSLFDDMQDNANEL